MRRHEITGLVFDIFGISMVCLLLGVVAFSLIEATYSIRAEPAKLSCRTKQMDAVRYTFSTTVVCVPFPTRQDTLSLRKVQ